MRNLRIKSIIYAFCFLLLLFITAKTFVKGKTDNISRGLNWAQGLVDEENIDEEVSSGEYRKSLKHFLSTKMLQFVAEIKSFQSFNTSR